MCPLLYICGRTPTLVRYSSRYVGVWLVSAPDPRYAKLEGRVPRLVCGGAYIPLYFAEHQTTISGLEPAMEKKTTS